MDYLFNEDVLLNMLRTGRKVHVVTNKPINLNILAQFRANILSYSHEIDATCPPEYVVQLKNIIPTHSFFSKKKDEAEIASLRMQFFDVCNIEKANDLSKEDYLDARS